MDNSSSSSSVVSQPHSDQTNCDSDSSSSCSSPGIGSPITSNSSEQSSEQSCSSFDDIFGPEVPSPLPENRLWTFKVVGDNLDKAIKPVI